MSYSPYLLKHDFQRLQFTLLRPLGYSLSLYLGAQYIIQTKVTVLYTEVCRV
jgi:hypothetical protein